MHVMHTQCHTVAKTCGRSGVDVLVWPFWLWPFWTVGRYDWQS